MKSSTSPSAAWQAPEPSRLPDFIICGAMKCGTTSLHRTLATHPDVYMPEGEIGFFDIDNLFQHRDFWGRSENKLIFQELESNPKLFWSWYNEKFSDRTTETVSGEDSTSYLASPIAFKRIAYQEKAIKLIVLLRHPTKRAYSNYWHLVRSGRMTLTFVEALKHQPQDILWRSCYAEQLESLFTQIPRERVLVLQFEELVKNAECHLERVCKFLGIDKDKFPNGLKIKKSNEGTYPRSPKLALRCNKLSQQGFTRYRNELPFGFTSPTTVKAPSRLVRLLQQRNHFDRNKPPPIDTEVQAFCDEYLRHRNQDLDELIGDSFLERWFNR